MELSGAGYLYNLSIVGITYAAVGALLMILRQGMGGKTSGFDAYLIAHTVASGFLISIDAMLPPLISLAGLEPGTVWASASALAAVLTGTVIAFAIMWRRKAVPERMPPLVALSYVLYCVCVVGLLANAIVPTLRNGVLFAAVLTLYLAVLMWSFVRRMATVIGSGSVEGWDHRR